MTIRSRIPRAGAVFRPVDFEAYVGRHRIYVEGVRPEMDTGRPAIVFVGGAFDGSWICRQQLDYWAVRGWPAYALNLRGYYKSGYRGVAGLGYRDYLDDIMAVRNHFGLTHAIYAGYSMGGILVQKFAELYGARALVLYDSDWPREVARLIGEKQDPGRRLPPVMNFRPTTRVVEEMLGRTVQRDEFHTLLELFTQSFLSGRAYRELEIERIEVDAARVTCPVLVVSVSSTHKAQSALARYYRASRLVFEGYSHGSILLGRFHKPITRCVTDWLDACFPRTVNKTYCFKKKDADGAPERKVKLFYFTGWKEPEVRLCTRRGQEVSRIAMRRVKAGRSRDESIFEADLPLDAGEKFHLAYKRSEDRPPGGGLYEPSGKRLYLMDGEFFPCHPPRVRSPRVYMTREIYSRAFMHHFTINIMLPRDYGRGERGPYPVAVLNDGQNQWENQGAHGGWHTDAIALDGARRGRCADVVLVAIVSHPQRDSTYLPPPMGRADRYVDFIADQVLSGLRKVIPISRDPGEIGIIGASYGANCAVYAGMRRPDSFGLVGSLSYPYVPEDPVRKSICALRVLPIRRWYADCGTRWAYDQPHRDDHTGVTRDLIALAQERGMVPGRNFLGIVAQGHYHNEVFWRERIGRCLEFLYPLR